TFRDESGFWSRFPPEDFANWTGLIQTALFHPKRFAEFLIAVLEPIALAEANAAHLAIAELEADKSVTVVTQNIDGLQQDAGSGKVLEIHGTLFEVLSVTSGQNIRRLTRDDLRSIVQDLREARESTWWPTSVMSAVQPLFG